MEENNSPLKKELGFEYEWVKPQKGYLFGPTYQHWNETAHEGYTSEQGWFYGQIKCVSKAGFNLKNQKLNLSPIDCGVTVALNHYQYESWMDLGYWMQQTAEGKIPDLTGLPASSGVVSFAARVGDFTAHGVPLGSVGSLNVFIGGRPAWRSGVDYLMCPKTGMGGVPDGGGPVMMGSTSVFINSKMACRLGDVILEPVGGANMIVSGCFTVLVGGGIAAPGGKKEHAKESPHGLRFIHRETLDLGYGHLGVNVGAVHEKDAPSKLGGGYGALGSGVRLTEDFGLQFPLSGEHSITIFLGFKVDLAAFGETQEWSTDGKVKAEAADFIGGGFGFSIETK